jgi:hypothetical protein
MVWIYYKNLEGNKGPARPGAPEPALEPTCLYHPRIAPGHLATWAPGHLRYLGTQNNLEYLGFVTAQTVIRLGRLYSILLLFKYFRLPHDPNPD